MTVQVPSVPPRSHAKQVPPQVVLQQTRSTQCPLKHSVPSVQACPFGRTHAPLPLQASGATQVPGSLTATGTLVQVPTIPPTAQDTQVPPHAALQQTPSTQMPLVHWLADMQPAPLACRGRHTDIGTSQ